MGTAVSLVTDLYSGFVSEGAEVYVSSPVYVQWPRAGGDRTSIRIMMLSREDRKMHLEALWCQKANPRPHTCKASALCGAIFWPGLKGSECESSLQGAQGPSLCLSVLSPQTPHGKCIHADARLLLPELLSLLILILNKRLHFLLQKDMRIQQQLVP